jgi:predicted TIM-barrel fold metal-dependent hydrolase
MVPARRGCFPEIDYWLTRYRNTERQEDGMIVDFHTVVHPYEMRAIRFSVDEFIRALDQYGIDQAVVSAPFYYVSDYQLANAKVARWVRQFPDRLVGFATINPYFEKEALDELQRCVDAGFKGMGEYHADLMSLPYDSALSMKVLEKAVTLKLPVLFHTGERCLDGALSAAKAFPEGKFVFAHIGSDKWRELLPFIAAWPHVSLCTSGTIFECHYLTETLKYAGQDRVIYGSDFIYLNPALCIGMVRHADIPESVKEKIFWKNARRLLEMP